MKIFTRAELGSRPFKSPPAHVSLASRKWFIVHYPGAGTPPKELREYRAWIERIHMDQNGWRGVGYNYFVDAYGKVGEGAGRDVVGAHSPPHNVDGIGVNVWTSNGVPTEAGKRACRALFDELTRQRGGKPLRIGWHGMDYATECPGSVLKKWAAAGMPVAASPGPSLDWLSMVSEKELRKIVREEVDRRCGDVVPAPSGYSKLKENPTWVLSNAVGNLLEQDQKVRAEQASQRKLIEALAKKLLTAKEVEDAAEAGAKAALDERIKGAEVSLTVERDA